jgi:hypothetical protein
LIFDATFFCARSNTVLPIRQKIPLLNSKENLSDSEPAQFQRLSVSTGQSSTTTETGCHPLIAQKTVDLAGLQTSCR